MGFRSLCQKVHMKERMKERISCNHRHDHQLSHALLLRLTNTCIDQDTVASVSDRPGNGPGTAQEPAFCGGPRPMTPACWAPSRDEPGCLWIVHCDSLYYPSNGTAVASLTPYVLPSLCQYRCTSAKYLDSLVDPCQLKLGIVMAGLGQGQCDKGFHQCTHMANLLCLLSTRELGGVLTARARRFVGEKRPGSSLVPCLVHLGLLRWPCLPSSTRGRGIASNCPSQRITRTYLEMSSRYTAAGGGTMGCAQMPRVGNLARGTDAL